jgi:hypothetical protein
MRIAEINGSLSVAFLSGALQNFFTGLHVRPRFPNQGRLNDALPLSFSWISGVI